MLFPVTFNMQNMPDITLSSAEVEAYLVLGMAVQGFEEVTKEYEWWTKERKPGEFHLTLLGLSTIKFRDDVVHGSWKLDTDGTVVGERNQEEFRYTLVELRNIAVNTWRHLQGHHPRAEDVKMELSVFEMVPTQRPDPNVCSPKHIERIGKYLGARDEWFQSIPQEQGVQDESSATLDNVQFRVADRFNLQIRLQHYTLECYKCNSSGPPQVNQPIPPAGDHKRGMLNSDWNQALRYVLKENQQKIWRQHLHQ